MYANKHAYLSDNVPIANMQDFHQRGTVILESWVDYFVLWKVGKFAEKFGEWYSWYGLLRYHLQLSVMFVHQPREWESLHGDVSKPQKDKIISYFDVPPRIPFANLTYHAEICLELLDRLLNGRQFRDPVGRGGGLVQDRIQLIDLGRNLDASFSVEFPERLEWFIINRFISRHWDMREYGRGRG